MHRISFAGSTSKYCKGAFAPSFPVSLATPSCTKVPGLGVGRLTQGRAIVAPKPIAQIVMLADALQQSGEMLDSLCHLPSRQQIFCEKPDCRTKPRIQIRPGSRKRHATEMNNEFDVVWSVQMGIQDLALAWENHLGL